MRSLNPVISEWKSCKVWIVGASSGIGAALATALSRQGALLALSARREAELQALASTSDLVLPLDVTDARSIQHASDMIRQAWGGIDLLIYCAGTYHPMRAWDIDLPKVEQTLAINLQGVFNTLHTVLPLLLKQQAGGICLVSSVAGYTGLPKALAYGPSKAAMINLAQVLYTDLSPRGIGVYLVNPGFVKTRLTEQNEFAMPSLITSPEAAEAIIKGLGRGRFEIHFPARFSRWMKLLAWLPDRLRFSLLRQVAAK